MGNCLKAALMYATKYKWAVFPVSQITKKPLTPHGCKDAKKDPGAIKNWWKKWPDASIGIATGAASGLIVIDEDIDENKGKDGYHEVQAWERINGRLPDTVQAITGRGGYHLYFKYDGTDIGNRTDLLDGVDVRGEGGYVIAPPSKHPNGTEYQWEYSPEDIEIAPVNDTVKKLLEYKEQGEGNEQFQLPERIGSGSRNDTLFRMAASMQAQGLPDAAILAAVLQTNKEKCDPPMDQDEVETIVSSALRYQKGEFRFKPTSLPEWHEPDLQMKIRDGEITDYPLQTIANAEEAITYDSKLYGHLFYNVMAYSPYVYGNLPWRQNRGWREWNNADDSYLESYIEKNYKLKSGDKTIKAFSNVVNRFQINPIKETLQECYQNWDGGKYIENLLPDFLGCEKSEYNTEVMKLIMLGAIHRIFKPGCKFDYMLVLVGEQGKGKSTFIRRLALNDQWFDDNFSTVEGVKALEKLRGKWFVELAELQANKRLKDVESMKAFVTSQIDVYRPPYGRRTEERPRMCILTGTSNPTDFLTDRTGNRRFLPVTCRVHTPKHDITKVSALEAKSIFASAWGEAMDIYEHMADKDRLVLPDRLQQMAIDQQEAYTADDPMVGMIQEYLDGLEEDRVCVMQIWENVFDSNIKPGRKEVNILHEIMRNKITGWKASGIQRTGKVYGNQRCYDRISKFAPIDIEEIPFDA